MTFAGGISSGKCSKALVGSVDGGTNMPEARPEEAAISDIELKNLFVRCCCGRDLKFTSLHQVRVCKCGRRVVIGEFAKAYLVSRYSKRKDEKGKP
jgi:hypothetical protein